MFVLCYDRKLLLKVLMEYSTWLTFHWSLTKITWFSFLVSLPLEINKVAGYRNPLRPVLSLIGPGKFGLWTRWQIFAKNATFQLDKWTRIQRSNFLYFLNKKEDCQVF
jgi:hypothetical protein